MSTLGLRWKLIVKTVKFFTMLVHGEISNSSLPYKWICNFELHLPGKFWGTLFDPQISKTLHYVSIPEDSNTQKVI